MGQPNFDVDYAIAGMDRPSHAATPRYAAADPAALFEAGFQAGAQWALSRVPNDLHQRVLAGERSVWERVHEGMPAARDGTLGRSAAAAWASWCPQQWAAPGAPAPPVARLSGRADGDISPWGAWSQAASAEGVRGNWPLWQDGMSALSTEGPSAADAGYELVINEGNYFADLTSAGQLFPAGGAEEDEFAEAELYDDAESNGEAAVAFATRPGKPCAPVDCDMVMAVRAECEEHLIQIRTLCEQNSQVMSACWGDVGDTAGGASSSSKGFDTDKQNAQRKFEKQIEELLHKLGARLYELCEDTPIDHYPVPRDAKNALAKHITRLRGAQEQATACAAGSQPWGGEDGGDSTVAHANYTQLLGKKGYLKLPQWFQGCQAPSNTDELPRLPEETADYDWGRWWLDVGGFKDWNQLDDRRWSALHHALYSMTFSWRAGEAAKQGIKHVSIETLNTKTIGSEGEPLPKGFTCLHFLCQGSDKSFEKRNLVIPLLEKKADIEAEDDMGNTPLLKAAGTGLADFVEILISRGANTAALNKNGKGALELAKGCSSTAAAMLRDARERGKHVPETRGQSGRTRTGVSCKRNARYERGLLDAKRDDRASAVDGTREQPAPMSSSGGQEGPQSDAWQWKRSERWHRRGPDRHRKGAPRD